MQTNYDPPKFKKPGSRNEETLPDQTPRREGGDDALSETTPEDSRADEKVIVNEQRSNKAVNAPSQTAVNINKETEDDI